MPPGSAPEELPMNFKKYSQMKLQIKREALLKRNRIANESGTNSDTGHPSQ